MDAALVAARLLLAAVFAVAGAAKLADMAGSRAAVAGFGVPGRLAAPLGTLLPFAELAIAALLLIESTARAGGIAALVLLTLFSVGIAASMARGEAPECHCFGQLHSEPAGARTLMRNVVLAGVAGFVAFAGADAGPGTVEEIGSLDATAAAVIAGSVAVALLISGCAAVVLWLLRQNGRLLLRVEAIEAALTARGIPIPVATVSEVGGLPVGTEAPAFEIPGPDGETVTLRSLISDGRPALLVFTSSDCGPCEELMPAVETWRDQHADHLTIAVVTHQEGREVAGRYEAHATPSAVLVGVDGRIDSAVAAGRDAISTLVERATLIARAESAARRG